MVKTKEDLRYFMECDRIALRMSAKHPRLFGDEIWKFERLMRKLDYYSSKSRRSLTYFWYKFRYHNLSLKLGFSIPYSICGPGLSIAHTGTIVISENCTIGNNCRIHVGVNIGANGGGSKAAAIGNNFILDLARKS